MLDQFFRFIHAIHPVSDSLKEALLRHTELLEFPAKYHLLREGQRNDHVCMILSGLMRHYYLKDGQEICSAFTLERNLVLSVNSFYTRSAGYEFIETLEPTVIARLHHDRLQQLYEEHLEFNYIVRVLTERFCLRSEERLYFLRKQTAEERYVYLLEQHPELLQRVPLKYLATYLGMNLETLSRIRKKMQSPGI